MSILNSYDLQMMQDDVEDIITGWNTVVTILRPKPVDQQTHYNADMREYTGDIDVDTILVNAERKDITNYLMYSLRSDVAGMIVDGDLIYAVPLHYSDASGMIRELGLTVDDIFVLPGDSNKYIVKAIKHRIGENLAILERYAGGTISGW